MYNWFECKIKYDKTLETGMQKVVSESYLVDALSFTEAEARVIKEMTPFISGEFSVANIKRVKFAESFFNESGDRYYKVKIYILSLDEQNGVEKKTAQNLLVQASDLKESVEIVEKEMKKTLSDYTMAAVSETPFIDVFFYSSNSQTE